MCFEGNGMDPSWRRAREYNERAIELGNSMAVQNMPWIEKAIQNAVPLMDKRVEIHGASRANMNVNRGIATDFHWYKDEENARYTIKLDGGEAFKVKPANVCACLSR